MTEVKEVTWQEFSDLGLVVDGMGAVFTRSGIPAGRVKAMLIENAKLDYDRVPRSVLAEFKRRFPSELSCLRYLEEQRWKNGVFCPKCGAKESKKDIVRERRVGAYGCLGCGEHFTARDGCMFEGDDIPIRIWLFAIYIGSATGAVTVFDLMKYGGVKRPQAERVILAMKKPIDVPFTL